MYLTYTRHRVKDYDTWRRVFDDNTGLLTDNGIKWVTVQVNGDPTDVAILCYCPAKESWDAFVAGNQAKWKSKGMNPQVEAGVIGQPEFWAGEIV